MRNNESPAENPLPRKSNPLRSLSARLMLALQRRPWYRRLVRRACSRLTITERERAGGKDAELQIRLEAFWKGHKVGWGWVVLHPAGFPTTPEWWVFSLEVDTPFRGMGVGEAIGQHALRLAADRGASELGALVRASNLPSISLCQKSGLELDATSTFPAEWQALHGVTEPYVLLRCPLAKYRVPPLKAVEDTPQ